MHPLKRKRAERRKTAKGKKAERRPEKKAFLRTEYTQRKKKGISRHQRAEEEGPRKKLFNKKAQSQTAGDQELDRRPIVCEKKKPPQVLGKTARMKSQIGSESTREAAKEKNRQRGPAGISQKNCGCEHVSA